MKRYFFSSIKNIRNIRNSAKVLLDLEKKYNRLSSKNNDLKNFSKSKENQETQAEKIRDSRKRLLKKKIINLENPIRKAKYFKDINTTIPFHNEKELQNRIYSCKSSEKLLNLYNGHKFTYSIKNIITSLTVFYKLYEKEMKGKKIQITDNRFMSLLYMANDSNSKMNQIEKVLLCIKMIFLPL